MALSPSMRSLRGGVSDVGRAGFDGVIEAFESEVRFGGALVQFPNMLAASLMR
jgi:hypothetical protein